MSVSHRRHLTLGAGIALAALMLAGCSQTTAPPAFALKNGVKSSENPALDRIFRLGVGDRLKIVVFGEDELSTEADVNASGAISMPLLGDVPAAGKTIEEFSAELRSQLEAGYLKSPKVNVQVLNYRPIYLQGEVKRGGEFPYKPGLTMADAVALAGGYSYRAVTSYVMLRRQGESQAREVPLDGSIPVLPGDNILVPERFF